MVVGVTLALIAAVGYGLSSVMQALGARKAARENAADHRMSTATGAPSLRSTAATAMTGVFIVGAIFDVLGFIAGAGAARMLPLFLSQTIVAGNLVITAVLGIRLLGIRLHTRDWVAIGTVLAALLILGAASQPHTAGATPRSLHWALLLATLVLVGLSIYGVRRMGPAGSVTAGAAAGLLFGAVAIGVRVLDGIDPFSLPTMLADPAAWVIAIAGASGFYLHTVALQLGAVNGSTAALVVGETAAPGIVGVMWLGDSTVPSLEWMALAGFTFAVLGAVAVALFGSAEAERSADENLASTPELDESFTVPADCSSLEHPPESRTGPAWWVDSLSERLHWR
ncbi:hypothetical protein [Gordonia rubripertincta]|uniref:Integral membrane protein n=1 Tax=Gordonia rubripertincta TaxID=36822 RepID=A0ABT4MZG2_GORRU|nr:hypothetical protein [Gordonia rubripertincta]MCZ4552404.1 hypothetical protein [Gordonia rubripertincta]